MVSRHRKKEFFLIFLCRKRFSSHSNGYFTYKNNVFKHCSCIKPVLKIVLASHFIQDYAVFCMFMYALTQYKPDADACFIAGVYRTGDKAQIKAAFKELIALGYEKDGLR